MKKIHLIMPMAGGGSRFLEKGFNVPKPLIEIHGKPFFYWATHSVLQNIKCIDVTFVVLEEHVKNFQIDAAIYKFFPNAKIKTVPQILPGAVCTCLEGIKDIGDNSPVIFNDCDHAFSCAALAERLADEKPLDFGGALVTFESSAPQFSYIKYNDSGEIIGTVEKKVVSNRAICGAYFFSDAALFRKMAEKYFASCSYKEFFISGVYNELFKTGKKISSFDVDFYISFGTPAEYEKAKDSPNFKTILQASERKI